ncbi:hypothetical protein [Paracidobacterium acidisoli]|uniref:Cytochrome c domain-containing protein n=1 Tax=Paracidobacterium acidisoli TaxID=2303751 RepID=A0A372ILI7_9BACT|nr:hypothetical protein [Paracidobacterium acidisoli]MBT9332367.1 hypothetical protein [Paracidobacterium acidisoli]
MKTMLRRYPTIFLLAGIVLLAASGTVPFTARAQTGSAGTKTSQSTQKTEQPRGERVFMNNCSRCHKPPMTIPPQITGTIVMHMRTRARLSSKDQQDLLRYLAP